MSRLVGDRVNGFAGWRVRGLNLRTCELANSRTREPIRVMYVIWSLGLGGAEQVVIRLATGLDRRRFTPIICCLNDVGAFAHQAQRRGIEVIALSKQRRYDLLMLWKLARLMRQRRVAIVHTHLWGANCWGRLAAWMAGVPVIIAHEHGMQPWRGRLHFFIDRLLMRLTDRVLFASEQVRQDYVARVCSHADRCQVIPNGVASVTEMANRHAMRQRLGWSEQDRIILSVGRLAPEKGYRDLLDAFATVLRCVPEARLVIIGDGAQRQELAVLHNRCGLNGHVKFLGRLDEVGPWFAVADLYVQPSHREGLPLAMLEAMAAGLPVVVTRVGDAAHVVETGGGGIVVPPQDPARLAQALAQLLQDPQRRSRLAIAAQATVQQLYSIEQMLDRVQGVYKEELMRDKGHGARGVGEERNFQ